MKQSKEERTRDFVGRFITLREECGMDETTAKDILWRGIIPEARAKLEVKLDARYPHLAASLNKFE